MWYTVISFWLISKTKTKLISNTLNRQQLLYSLHNCNKLNIIALLLYVQSCDMTVKNYNLDGLFILLDTSLPRFIFGRNCILTGWLRIYASIIIIRLIYVCDCLCENPPC